MYLRCQGLNTWPLDLGLYNPTFFSAIFNIFQIIVIDIVDINDHSPVFGRQRYIEEVAENHPPGTYVTTVTANDRDAGQNSLLKYSLIGSSVDLFNIDEVTGELTTNKRLDYEREPRIELGVLATDSGNPPRSAAAVIEVNMRKTIAVQRIFKFKKL